MRLKISYNKTVVFFVLDVSTLMLLFNTGEVNLKFTIRKSKTWLKNYLKLKSVNFFFDFL